MADVNVLLRNALDRLTQRAYTKHVVNALHDYGELSTLELKHEVEKAIGRELRRPLNPLLWQLEVAGILKSREDVPITKQGARRMTYYKLDLDPVNRRIKLLFED